MEKYGFVYVWYDRKRKMYYVGSHWGTENDGYICSSNKMRNAYRRRPNDFKRRVISRIYTTRQDLLTEEHGWLILAEKNKDIHYNINYNVHNYWWLTSEDNKLSIKQKISKTQTGKKLTQSHKKKISKSNKGRILSEEHKAFLSFDKKMRVYIYKEKEVKHIYKSELDSYIKMGWGIGNLNKRYACSWYTNGENNIMLKKGTPPPTGYIRGRSSNNYYYFKKENSDDVIIVTNLKCFCNMNNLNYSKMTQLHKETLYKKQYKGYIKA